MKSVLILDDDIDLSEILELTIKHLGVTLCKVIHSYKEILELNKVELTRFDICLLDVNLGPGQPNGLEVYKHLKQVNYPGEIYFFTGHGKSDSRLQVLTNFSLTHILEKPVSIETLNNIIQ